MADAETRTIPPVIAPLTEADLPEADRIFRLAFGTLLGVPDPGSHWTDLDYVCRMSPRSAPPWTASWSARIS
jgi:hypothetical protein